jgi:hypothetical protein
VPGLCTPFIVGGLFDGCAPAVPSALCTNEVVAIALLLSFAGGGGAVGVPVTAGEASGAREVSDGCRCSPRE